VTEEAYIALVGEVFDGYTEVDFKGDPLFVKHFSIRDQSIIYKSYNRHKSSAIKRGVETEEQILKRLKDDDIWTDDDDLKIAQLSSEVENLKSTQKSLFIPSQKTQLQKEIDQKRIDLFNLQIKRKEVVGRTAEDYASSLSSQESIRYFLFKDKDFKDHAFSHNDFEELDDRDLMSLTSIQSEMSSRANDVNLQMAALRPFFSMYLSQCENLGLFYGKPVINLSVFQLKLALYGRMFHNIFQNVDNIPDNIREDPEKLMSFAESQTNKSSSKKFIKDDSDASVVFGANKEDMNIIAPDSKNNTVSLSEEMRKAGGTLNMEQMIKLAGH
jgi:hypothetical protein